MKSSRPPSGGDTQTEVPEALIRRLSDLLHSTDLAEIELQTGAINVRVKAKEQVATNVLSTPAPKLVAQPSESKAASESTASDLHIIRSPFVGSFYRAPSPTSSPYVEEGQTITKGQVLCIIEAMKIMNEIEADAGGVIEKIYVEDGTPVDFNAPLFGIRK